MASTSTSRSRTSRCSSSWFEGGEVFRSGCCWHRGKGKVFYFRPGHEVFPDLPSGGDSAGDHERGEVGRADRVRKGFLRQSPRRSCRSRAVWRARAFRACTRKSAQRRKSAACNADKEKRPPGIYGRTFCSAASGSTHSFRFQNNLKRSPATACTNTMTRQVSETGC